MDDRSPDGAGDSDGDGGRVRVRVRERDDPRIDEIIANAHEVLANWDKMQPTTYGELTPTSKIILEELLKTHLPEKLAENISEEYARYPEDMRQQFVNKDVGAEIGQTLYYARILLATHFGLNADSGEIDIDLQNDDPEVLKEYALVLTGVIALTHNTRDFSESSARAKESLAKRPMDTAVKLALAPFAIKVAAELAPVGTAIVNVVSGSSHLPALANLANMISDYAFNSRSAAFYAAVYVAVTKADQLLPSEAQAGDLQGIFDDLSKRADRDSREKLTGPKPDISTVWGAANYVLWRAKSVCVSQAELAVKGAGSVYKLAAAAPEFCQRIVGHARKIMSDAAKSLEMGGLRGVTDVTCRAFHDKLRELLQTKEFESLQANASVIKHMANLERADSRPFLPFERRVEYFAAVQVVQARSPQELRPYMMTHSMDSSQQAQRDTPPNMEDVESLAEETMLNKLPDVTDVLGPNGEWLGEISISRPEETRPSSSGNLGGRSRSRKRSASKRTRRKGAAKKQKSKKNKRQSRRKARRSSSRKSRK